LALQILVADNGPLENATMPTVVNDDHGFVIAATIRTLGDPGGGV
jgi:hypothetical protein